MVTSVGTGLLNPLESSLESSEEIRFTELSVTTTESDQMETDRPLWWLLALVAFGVMLLEWWYFQRGLGALA